jgi:hypothetical protein
MKPRRESDEKTEFSNRKIGIIGVRSSGFLHYAG